MSITVSTDIRQVNATLFLSCLGMAVAWIFWPDETSYWQSYVVCAVFGFIGVMGFVKGCVLLVKDYKLRRNLALSQAVSTDHGSARQSTFRDIIDRVMDRWDSGNFLGLFEGTTPVFAPPGTPFSLFEMSTGVGKTTRYVVGSIQHNALQGRSVVVSDVKLELAPSLIGPLRERGIEVWCVNPTRAHYNLCGDVELNVFQPLVDAVYAEDDKRLDASTICSDLAELCYPQTPNEKQPYFSNGSRRIILSASGGLALTDPINCTPSGVYDLISDPEKYMSHLEEVVHCLETNILSNPFSKFLKSEAANLLHRAENNPENFGAFLEGATQRLLPFNQSGRLAGYGQNTMDRIAELRERPIVLFIMAPLSHIRDFSVFLSLLNHNVIAACKDNPNGVPVHIVAEEALQYRFKDLPSTLEVVRSYGVTADFFIQSFSGLTRLYGKEEAQSIESYMDVKVYAGLNSFDRAKHVSDMLSQTTLRKQDYSYDSTGLKKIGVSSRELGRKLAQPDEILTMDRNKAWVFVRGMHPMNLTMAHYGQVDPWRDMIDPVPGGPAPLRDDPLVQIDYPSGETS